MILVTQSKSRVKITIDNDDISSISDYTIKDIVSLVDQPELKKTRTKYAVVSVAKSQEVMPNECR